VKVGSDDCASGGLTSEKEGHSRERPSGGSSGVNDRSDRLNFRPSSQNKLFNEANSNLLNRQAGGYYNQDVVKPSANGNASLENGRTNKNSRTNELLPSENVSHSRYNDANVCVDTSVEKCKIASSDKSLGRSKVEDMRVENVDLSDEGVDAILESKLLRDNCNAKITTSLKPAFKVEHESLDASRVSKSAVTTRILPLPDILRNQPKPGTREPDSPHLESFVKKSVDDARIVARDLGESTAKRTASPLDWKYKALGGKYTNTGSTDIRVRSTQESSSARCKDSHSSSSGLTEEARRKKVGD